MVWRNARESIIIRYIRSTYSCLPDEREREREKPMRHHPRRRGAATTKRRDGRCDALMCPRAHWTETPRLVLAHALSTLARCSSSLVFLSRARERDSTRRLLPSICQLTPFRFNLGDSPLFFFYTTASRRLFLSRKTSVAAIYTFQREIGLTATLMILFIL